IEDPLKLRNLIGNERSALVNRLEDQGPARRDPDMTSRLKTLEVAFAASQWSDENHPNAVHAVDNAIKGLSTTGNALRSRLFELETENSTPKENPPERCTVRVDHRGL